MLVFYTNTKEDIFKKIYLSIFKDFHINYNLELIFVSSDFIKKINFKYRKKNKPTDILSFAISNEYGQIFICKSYIKKNLPKYRYYINKDKITFFNALIYVYIHGLAHLLGYDHKNNDEEKKMNDFILNIFYKFNN